MTMMTRAVSAVATVLGAAAIVVSALFLVGCPREGPAENAGEALDRASEDAADAAGEAADDAADAVEDAADELEDAADR